MQLHKNIILLSEQSSIGKNVVECVDWIQMQSYTDDMIANFEIVLSEALNNIVEHAYQYCEDGKIEIGLTSDVKCIDIDLIDHGKQFPGVPLKKEMHGNEIAFEDLPEGGFGWFLIHSLTDKISYRLADGKNILSLRMIDGV